MAQQPLVLHGRPITEASGSRSHHIQLDSSERVISPTKRSLPHITQETQQADIHAPGKIRTCNPSKRTAADARLRPCGHWDRRHLHTWPKRYETGRGRMREKYHSILSHFRPVCTSSTVRFPRRSPTNTVLTFLVSALELLILIECAQHGCTDDVVFSNTIACSFAFRSGMLLQFYFEHYTPINLKYTFSLWYLFLLSILSGPYLPIHNYMQAVWWASFCRK